MQWFKEGNNRTAFLILNFLLTHYLGSNGEYVLVTNDAGSSIWKELLQDVMISRNTRNYRRKKRNASFGKLQRYIEAKVSRYNIVEFMY